jgi:hypothetical protein
MRLPMRFFKIREEFKNSSNFFKKPSRCFIVPVTNLKNKNKILRLVAGSLNTGYSGNRVSKRDSKRVFGTRLNAN